MAMEPGPIRICIQPHPDRRVANGLPLYISYVEYFGDDVSGNQSKAWNKHWNQYLSHRNLPRHTIGSEFHVHLLSTSQDLSIPQQFRVFKKIIESTKCHPIQTLDSLTGKHIKLQLVLLSAAADNPMVSELASHIGAKGNYYCRKCTTGGTDEEKQTNATYHTLFS
ncbi:hypothetical protein ACJ73_10240, partial [Blastomyces percursus]